MFDRVTYTIVLIEALLFAASMIILVFKYITGQLTWSRSKDEDGSWTFEINLNQPKSSDDTEEEGNRS